MDVFFEKYYFWLSSLASYSVLVPVLFGVYLLLRTKRANVLLKCIVAYVLFMMLVEASGLITVSLDIGSNLWISHVYVPIEYALFSCIYYISFRQRPIRTGILLSALLFALFCLGDSLYWTGIHQMNSTARVIESALLISLVLLYFYTLYKDMNYVYLERDPVFLLSCGVLIYFSGTAMAFEMFNYALAISDNMARVCLTITFVLNISFNGLLVVVERKATTA